MDLKKPGEKGTLQTEEGTESALKQLKQLTRLVQHMLGQGTEDHLVTKISQYCFNLLQSRVFASSSSEVDNYT